MAKTLLVRTLAAALQLDFKRVQFARSDAGRCDRVTGIRRAHRSLRVPGRTGLHQSDARRRNQSHPAETQAALLEAMEERQVSVDGRARTLPDPFIVAAAEPDQNTGAPINFLRRSWTGSC